MFEYNCGFISKSHKRRNVQKKRRKLLDEAIITRQVDGILLLLVCMFNIRTYRFVPSASTSKLIDVLAIQFRIGMLILIRFSTFNRESDLYAITHTYHFQWLRSITPTKCRVCLDVCLFVCWFYLMDHLVIRLKEMKRFVMLVINTSLRLNVFNELSHSLSIRKILPFKNK